ncbi:hypothetical protein IJD44_00515 [bacterium]|nr:hypothetical protein [bacterium]
MVQNISFGGAHSRYVANKFVERATMGELAETINRGISDASKKIGQKISTVDGKRITGTMLSKMNPHLIKNGHLSDEGFEAFAQMWKLDNLNLGTFRKKIAEIAAKNAYSEGGKGIAKLTIDPRYLG